MGGWDVAIDAEQFNQMYVLVFCIGLIISFGLGALKGGQR